MARTFGGMIFYGAAQLNLPLANQGVAAGQYAWVKNGVGDISLNNAAGVSTVPIWMNLADIKRPFISFPAFPGQGTTIPTSSEFQNLFGTAAGGPSNPMGGSATGLNFFGTPGVPWGIAIIDVFAVYSVVTAALTTATLGITRATYTENAAFTNSTVLAATAIATTTTTGAGTPHVQKVALAQPLVYETSDISDVTLEMVITTAATSAVRVYGLGMHVAVEFS